MVKLQIAKISMNETRTFIDTLAVEEPLEIRLDYAPDPTNAIRKQKSISITMRTPGADRELAVGFLFTEGLIQSRSDVVAIEACGPKQNVMKITLVASEAISSKISNLDRSFYTTSSCGVCGKSSIDALKTQNQFTTKSAGGELTGPKVSKAVLTMLPIRLREAQSVFESTGGLHASGLFTMSGELLDLREDVGRHNALDKVIGHAFLNSTLPLHEHVLMLSGRISFELVQKSAMAGLKFIAAVGAPSSLAVELANEMDMTLIGFLRGDSFNLYTGKGRLA